VNPSYIEVVGLNRTARFGIGLSADEAKWIAKTINGFLAVRDSSAAFNQVPSQMRFRRLSDFTPHDIPLGSEIRILPSEDNRLRVCVSAVPIEEVSVINCGPFIPFAAAIPSILLAGVLLFLSRGDVYSGCALLVLSSSVNLGILFVFWGRRTIELSEGQLSVRLHLWRIGFTRRIECKDISQIAIRKDGDFFERSAGKQSAGKQIVSTLDERQAACVVIGDGKTLDLSPRHDVRTSHIIAVLLKNHLASVDIDVPMVTDDVEIV
jgi:hypothetical protein